MEVLSGDDITSSVTSISTIVSRSSFTSDVNTGILFGVTLAVVTTTDKGGIAGSLTAAIFS